MSSVPTHSVFKRIRVRKEDSAFVYFILESHEGIASYSTLDHRAGDPYRDLELRIPPDFVQEVEALLQSLGEPEHCPDGNATKCEVYALDDSSDRA